MTVSGWVIFGIVTFLIFLLIVGFTCLVCECALKPMAISIVFSIVICVALLAGMLFYFNGTAGGKRAFKTQESNFNNGIKRKVEVYDAVGNLIKTYEGKFDIDYDDDRIIFDDENSKRHVIYYPTGTIIVDEV